MNDPIAQHFPPTVADGPARPTGFTLIELMVSVTILVVMILSFSVVLTQCQKVVSNAQRATQANAAAGAIAKWIRDDLTSLSKDGFLAIKNAGTTTPTLIFTAANAYDSMMGCGSTADAAIVAYGRTDGSILWRDCTLLDPYTDVHSDHDHKKNSLADYYKDPTGTSNAIDAVATPTFSADPANFAPAELRKYMAGACSSFQVSYVRPDPPVGSWFNPVFPTGSPPAWTTGASANGTWTWENKAAWPIAIRVQFTLGEYDDAIPYEVIVYTGGR